MTPVSQVLSSSRFPGRIEDRNSTERDRERNRKIKVRGQKKKKTHLALEGENLLTGGPRADPPLGGGPTSEGVQTPNCQGFRNFIFGQAFNLRTMAETNASLAIGGRGKIKQEKVKGTLRGYIRGEKNRSSGLKTVRGRVSQNLIN